MKTNKKFKLEIGQIPEEQIGPLYRWSQSQPDTEDRNLYWDEYCDVRDNVPSGTSRAFRLAHNYAPGEEPKYLIGHLSFVT